MSLTVSIVFGVLGLFAGALIWNAARNQAANAPILGVAGERRVLLLWAPVAGFVIARDQPRARWRIPFELLMGVYWGIAAHTHDSKLDLAAVLVFSFPLAIILLVDLWTRLIHTNLIMAGAIAGLAFAAADSPTALLKSFAGMVVATLVFALFFLLAAALYRNVRVVPFGLGDVYLAAMIGAMVRLGFIAPALFLGIVLGGVSLVLLLLLKRVSRRQAVAYGPYLCLGAMITLLAW
jgi:leader peptidase (prepilin peptidase) / N-methyltransferase